MTILRAGNRLLAPGANVQKGRTVVGGGDWWDYSGVVAAYDAKNASSLANSYVNLANPGTYDAAPGVAPTWGSGTGWTFNASTMYLIGPAAVSEADSLFICYNGLSTNVDNHTVAGFYKSSPSAAILIQNNSAQKAKWFNGLNTSTYTSSGAFPSGVAGMAGKAAYEDGINVGTISAGTHSSSVSIYIGALNFNGSANQYANVVITSFWFGSSTLSSGDVAALSTAMAAL